MEQFAKQTGLSPLLAEHLVMGKAKVRRSSAQLIAQAFGQDAQTWLNLQATYDKWEPR
jgi:plasmid maintenance system antidote protein VapI